jgi:hypothetical protein
MSEIVWNLLSDRLDESTSHGHHILSGELEQHRLVEELVQRDVVGQTLSSSRFDREFSRQSRHLLKYFKIYREI